jgi:hypothetical protein
MLERGGGFRSSLGAKALDDLAGFLAQLQRLPGPKPEEHAIVPGPRRWHPSALDDGVVVRPELVLHPHEHRLVIR